jgi:hypothetical protein
MVTGMIRRLFLRPQPEKYSRRIAEMLQRLAAAGLSEEDIAYLAQQPAMPTLSGWTTAERQSIIVACVEGRGNPVYDQRRIEAAKLEAQIGPEFADTVLAPTPDPTQIAEQQRQQILENGAILDGTVVPVSPRDAHAVHLASLMPVIQGAIQEVQTNPKNTGGEQLLRGLVAHAKAHIQLAAGDPAVAQYAEIILQLEQALAAPPPDPAPEPAPAQI